MNSIKKCVENNEGLVIIWNYLSEKTNDQEMIGYSKNKIKQLKDLREAKRFIDNFKKEFDKKYVQLINKEIEEVEKYDRDFNFFIVNTIEH